MNNTDEPGFLPPHGNYEELLSYQKAEVIYDLTWRFCQRFLNARDRTVDQMMQAARCGQTEHRRRQEGGSDIERDGTQIDQRRPRQFGRIAVGLSGLFAGA